MQGLAHQGPGGMVPTLRLPSAPSGTAFSHILHSARRHWPPSLEDGESQLPGRMWATSFHWRACASLVGLPAA